jgi:hypothetical protein
MSTVRKTRGRAELDELWDRINGLIYKTLFAAVQDPGIADATSAGQLQTANAADFKIDGFTYNKVATDDLWDLSGETDTGAAAWRAYWLYLDAAGAASIDAGSDAASAALALKALPDLDTTKSILGVFVADPSCDFDDAGGLSAQGTIYDGVPEGVPGFDTALDYCELVFS